MLISQTVQPNKPLKLREVEIRQFYVTPKVVPAYCYFRLNKRGVVRDYIFDYKYAFEKLIEKCYFRIKLKIRH